MFGAIGLDGSLDSLSFDRVDADGDGSISREELRAAAVHLYPLADPTWLTAASGCSDRPRGIALVAHDARKEADPLAWTDRKAAELKPHRLYGTGTTGSTEPAPPAP
ncbi:hypothetical protein ACFYYB_13465 [Streptomyces sp. NPDC002886]|uniref:hypothetical protein n=1 Tax=Streptomyces sp. NPDC002886 TaxID=3364667 RepID=UPI0036AB1250